MREDFSHPSRSVSEREGGSLEPLTHSRGAAGEVSVAGAACHQGTIKTALTQLRPYQAEAIERLRNAYRQGARKPLLVLPTGGGKTIVFSHIAAAAVAKGRSVLVLVHRRELLRQASEKLAAAGVAHGIIAPGYEATADPVQVASVQTLARRLQGLRKTPPQLIIIDEAHHAVAGQWRAVLAAFPNAQVLGVTASPVRADGAGLGAIVGGVFDALVLGPTVAELTAMRFLVPPRIFAPIEAPDLSGIRLRGGDYDPKQLAAAPEIARLVGDAVEHYARHAPGLPMIVFCVDVQHAEATAEAFRAAGWRAAAVSGKTPIAERDRAIGGLGTGDTQVLTNCDLLGEGLDVPAVAAVALLRPTKSLALYLQQVGRGLRIADGKDALVVFDHAGNSILHGPPDAPRRWSLDGQKIRRTSNRRQHAAFCQRCAAVLPGEGASCEACGAAPMPCERNLHNQPGQFHEVTMADVNRLQALRTRPLKALVREAQSVEDLVRIQRVRGYKPTWVPFAWHECIEHRRGR
jgi:superfamily II DNA or RNA helicase